MYKEGIVLKVGISNIIWIFIDDVQNPVALNNSYSLTFDFDDLTFA